MEVYFVRHGESEYNVRHLVNFTPSVLVNLTEKGKTQVRAAAKKLTGKKFDLIYVSEFMRTQETAVILASALGTRVKIDKRVNEIVVGKEGDSNVFYKSLLVELLKNSSYKFKGGESFDDVRARLESFRKSLEKKRYKRVIVVTHEFVCVVARTVFGGVPAAKSLARPVENAEILRFKI